MTLLTRNDVLLIAETQYAYGAYAVKIHAVPKTSETKKMVQAMNEGTHRFNTQDISEKTCCYVAQKDRHAVLSAENETWNYLAWDKDGTTDTAWALLHEKSENQKAVFGILGMPYDIRHTLTASKKSEDDAPRRILRSGALTVTDPQQGLDIAYTHVHFGKLPRDKYATRNVHLKMTPQRLAWVQFGKKDHPVHGINKVSYGENYLHMNFERCATSEDDTELNISLQPNETSHLMCKLSRFGRNMAQVCEALNIPDVTPFNAQPKIIRDINDTQMDAVVGAYCPLLDKTYRRLGIHFEL